MGRKNDIHQDITAADKTGKAFKSAQNNMRNLASSAAILEGPLGKVAGRINSLGAALGRMNPLMIAGGVASATMLVGFKTSVEAAGELEQQMLKLEAALRATGRLSDTSAEELNVFAQQLGEATLTSAKAVREAQAALATFKNIDTDQFERVLTLAQDMSATFGGELKSNVIKVARALDNPREGLSGLSRNILSTSVAWREMNAEMFESGRQAEAQGQLLSILESKVGGAGTAEAGGLSGAVDTLGERWTRLMESIGNSGTLSRVTSLVNSAAAALGWLTSKVEDSTGVQERYKRLIELNEPLLRDMGFLTTELANAQRDAVVQQNIINTATRLGIDLQKEADFSKLTNEYKGFALALAGVNAQLQAVTAAGGDNSQATKNLSERIEFLRGKLDEVVAKYPELTAAKKIDANVTTTILKDAQTQIDAFTKKSQDRRDNAETAFVTMRNRLVSLGVEGQTKLQELQAAYSGFLYNLDLEDEDRTRKKADKAIQIEESKIARLRAILAREEGNRENLGLPNPEQEAANAQAAADAKYEMDVANVDRRLQLLREAGVSEFEATRVIEEKKELFTSISAEKRRQIEEKLVLQKRELNKRAITDVGDLLAIVGKKSKAAAKAAEIVQKGLMIQQTIASTQAAAMRAYAELGPIAGPPVAGAITALGAAAVGVIATTSASGGGSGGASGGVSAGPAVDIPAIPNEAQTQQQQTTIIFVGSDELSESQIDAVMSGISDKINEGSQIIIRRDSPQAQEIALAVGAA